MSKKEHKTNAARILSKAGIQYEQLSCGKPDEFLSGVEVARLLNEDPQVVYKTLVTKSNNGSIYVAVIPSDRELDLKKLAKVVGEKKMDMIAPSDILKTTGYVKGGCSPIGMKKSYPTFLHESALDQPYIYCSAGKRGMQLKLSPEDLAYVSGGKFENLIK